jgi:O-antigen ligase
MFLAYFKDKGIIMSEHAVNLKKGKIIPFLVALLFGVVSYCIPDSKASTFLQISTSIGTLTPSKILILMCFVLCFTIVLIRNLKIPKSYELGLFLIYSYWVFFTSFVSLFGHSYSYFQISFLTFEVIMNFAVFLISYVMTYNYKNFKSYLKNGIIVFGLINSILMIVQHYYNEPILIGDFILRERGFWLNGERVSRVWGFQGEPLAAASVTMVSIILLIESFSKQNKIKIFIKIISLATMVSALVFTFSRGSLLSLVLAIGYWLQKKGVRLLNVKRLLLLIVLSPIAIYFMRNYGILDLIYQRFDQLNRDQSFFARWEIIKSVWRITQEIGVQVLIGLGAGGGIGIRDYTGGALDNQYLNIYFETGLIGLVILTILFIRLLRKSNNISLEAVLFALICNMVTYEMFYYSSIGVLFWCILGVLAAENFKYQEVCRTGEETAILNHKTIKHKKKRIKIVW